MNLLLNPLPRTNKYGQVLRTDFRYWANFARILDDNSLDDATRIQLALQSVYINPDYNNIEQLMDGALDFLRLGEPAPEKTTKYERLLDFDKDAAHIIVSFQQQYGIRLMSERMHWWEFRTLLNGLSEDTIMGFIMHIRAAKISTDMSKYEKQRLMKLKRIYGLNTIKETQKLTEDEFIKNVQEQERELRKKRVEK